jgi:hypothetical protein
MTDIKDLPSASEIPGLAKALPETSVTPPVDSRRPDGPWTRAQQLAYLEAMRRYEDG